MELHVRNVNEALADGLAWLDTAGVEEESRNGPVIVSPEPVMTIYKRPTERVLFSPQRDANPFFHLFESLWMLAGRNDIGYISQFVPRMKDYSDDGITQHGAYGFRWLNWFGYNQLELIVKELISDPTSRRCVLSMWDGEHDLDYALTPGSKDAPCNTHIYFDARDGDLNMTVLNRSNDIWWGAYGANAVHFSILQEYLASWMCVRPGIYRQFSNNFHIYTKVVPRTDFADRGNDSRTYNLYNLVTADVRPSPLVAQGNTIRAWDAELNLFLADPLRKDYAWQEPFFKSTAVPMYRTWYMHKREQHHAAFDSSEEILASDWRRGVQLWLAKRKEARGRKSATANA